MAHDEFAHGIKILFGQNFQAAQLRAGLTRREVAARAGMGWPRSFRSKRAPRIRTMPGLAMLAKVVGRAASDLLM